ncbi:MAG TPA: VOC family protein [Ignavibacteria bacterium]|nr:VOC family protein [Ignavibacteria bacterium]
MKFKFSPFIAIQVKDHSKATEFYKNILGMEFKEEKGNDVYLNKDGINFVYENGGKPGTVFFEFSTDDIKEAQRELEENGCKMTQEFSEKSKMFSDPYGMNFHIWEE